MQFVFLLSESLRQYSTELTIYKESKNAKKKTKTQPTNKQLSEKTTLSKYVQIL
jgi:hypothetical protein